MSSDVYVSPLSGAVAQKIAAWVCAFKLESSPQDITDQAIRAIIDTLGVAVAGSSRPSANKARALLRRQYGAGISTILGTGETTSATAAAWANAYAAHILDFDDTTYAPMLHVSAIVLPAVLAVAEAEELDGKKFLQAFIAGWEVCAVLGKSLGEFHYKSGWWASGTCGAVAAAAACSKLLASSEIETRSAIAIAATQASGMVAVLGTDAKHIQAGRAAALGVEAALFAKSGFTGPADAFENYRGFVQLMNDGFLDTTHLQALGNIWSLGDPGIAIKTSPLCSAAQAPVELMKKMLSAHEILSDHVDKVHCEGNRLVYNSLVYSKPATVAQAQFSMPFAVGAVLDQGELSLAALDDDYIASPALHKQMSKVTFEHCEEMDQPEFLALGKEGIRISIIGSTFSVTDILHAPRGSPSNPLSINELAQKFISCVTYAGGQEQWASVAIDSIHRVLEVSNIGKLEALNFITASLGEDSAK